ncbi:MAG: gas vesicle protein [Atribacterota bacterium]
MKPNRDSHATLVDLLDRVIDKGLIIDLDLIIHVAGIPLLGVKLKACLAGIETMLQYGIWKDWDEAQRAVASEDYQRKKKTLLSPGEKVEMKVFASVWYEKGIYRSWRPGYLYLTDRRVMLMRKEPAEVLFECLYEDIKGMMVVKKMNTMGKETEHLSLKRGSGEIIQLHPVGISTVQEIILKELKARGREVENTFSLPEYPTPEI